MGYQPPPEPDEESENDGEHVELIVMMANISSYKLHHNEALDLAQKQQADVVLLTETRIRAEAEGARIQAATAGYRALLSDPRPLKEGRSQGPKEGGVAILLKDDWNVPDLGRTAAHPQLDSSYACHTAIPLSKAARAPVLHCIVAYCAADAEEQRQAVLDYAEALGDVPVLVAADWNQPPEESAAIRNALISGRWVEAAGHSAAQGDKRAAEICQTATTHRSSQSCDERPRTAVRGRRIDYFMLNKCAAPYLTSVECHNSQPLPNHYAVQVTLTLPVRTPTIRVLTKTTAYHNYQTIAHANVAVATQWEEADACSAAAWSRAVEEGNVEHLWQLWNVSAETALRAITLEAPEGRPKGTVPKLRQRSLWAPSDRAGAEPRRERELPRAYTRALRLRCLIEIERSLTPQETSELSRLGPAVEKVLLTLGTDVEVQQLQSWATKSQFLQRSREKLRSEAKVLRVKLWREKITANIQNACRWVRGEQAQLTHLDSNSGIVMHPQDIAEEVGQRSRQQFGTLPDIAKRRAFLEQFTADIPQHHCDLPPITPKRLRTFVLRKPDGAVGTDGWHARELMLLPKLAWARLAELCEQAERSGCWPRSLTIGIVAGLRKPGPEEKGIRLRLLRIMPRILRGWASMRCADIKQWTALWAPPELYGGIPTEGTETASAPVTIAMADATLNHRPLIGTSLDYTACFDRIDPFLAIDVLERHGLPDALCRALRAIYTQLSCFCRVGQASTSSFQSTIGIIQGCAFSCTLLNSLMAVWVCALRRHVGPDFWRDEKIILGVYLDDRNLLAASPGALQRLLRFGNQFDDLISSELNEGKCQVYSSAALPAAEYSDVLPQAERTCSPWSLGLCVASPRPAAPA